MKKGKVKFQVSGHNDHIGVYETIGIVEAKSPRGANQIAKRKFGADKWSDIYLTDEKGNYYEFGNNYPNY